MNFFSVFAFSLSICFVQCKVFTVEHNTNTNETEDDIIISDNSQPCPCDGQPEGITMPHTTDCRTYYTCLGSSNVRYSRCDNGHFYHPYLGHCVQRATYLSIVPNIVETKDICKINSVFRPPVAENFDHCHITSDDLPHPESNSVEDSSPNGTDKPFSFTSTVERVGFPWATTTETPKSKLDSPAHSSSKLTTTDDWPTLTFRLKKTSTTTSTTTPTPPTTPLHYYPNRDCKMSKVIVYHFPGPCRAEITCEGGGSFTVNNCINTLTFISQVNPGMGN